MFSRYQAQRKCNCDLQISLFHSFRLVCQGLRLPVHASPLRARSRRRRDLRRWRPQRGVVKATRPHSNRRYVIDSQKGDDFKVQKYEMNQVIRSSEGQTCFLTTSSRLPGPGVRARERPVVDALDGRAGGEQKGRGPARLTGENPVHRHPGRHAAQYACTRWSTQLKKKKQNGKILTKDPQWLIEFLSAVDDSSAKTPPDEAEKEPKKEGEPEKNGKEPPKANNEVRRHFRKIRFLKLGCVDAQSLSLFAPPEGDLHPGRR